MTSRILALLVLLLAPAPKSESVRLRRLFEEHWATRLRESPELATYVGYPNDRWSDLSPESTARAYEIARKELAALSAIDRSRLTASERVDYDLLRRRLERQIEGRRFHDLGSYLLIDHMNGIDLDLVQLLDYMPGGWSGQPVMKGRAVDATVTRWSRKEKVRGGAQPHPLGGQFISARSTCLRFFSNLCFFRVKISDLTRISTRGLSQRRQAA